MWPVEQRIPLVGAVLLCAALLWPEQPARAQFTQQGPKLVGGNAIGAAEQGRSVALSADSSWVIVGGPTDNNNAGAVWFFVRSGRTWVSFQKLSATDAGAHAQQGYSVALSADGTTAIEGGPPDNGNTGAAWVFTLSNGVWSPQTTKLVGSNAKGSAQQGTRVALSADGNTAIVGGPYDNCCDSNGFGVGAAWVFTRSGGWFEEAKLVASNATGNAGQGSVALSADGNTAIVGGPFDNGFAGAAWVFTRKGGTWSQQAKLFGNDAMGNAEQGFSVALSADGGAAWVFTRSGGVWSQQGNKLVASDAMGNAEQGYSVALFCNAAIVGGLFDNSPAPGSAAGAAWAFVRPATATHDFSCDGMSDILWWNSTTGQAVIWLMKGSSVVGGGSPGSPPTDWAIVGQRLQP
jgi:hypothetical protein